MIRFLMPRGPLPDEIQRFLAAPRPAVVGWLRDDGGPTTAPVWYRFADGTVELSMNGDGRRARQLRQDPRLALTVLGDSWYTHVSLECAVTSIVEDRAHERIDALSVHYTGEPYTDHETSSVAVTAAVERWHTFGEI
jgi:PPOX class probable F420-dependent enzyme